MALLLLLLHTYVYCNTAAQRLDWDNIKRVIKTNVKSIQTRIHGYR